MSLITVELLIALAEIQFARRRCWPTQLSFTEYVSLHRICRQLSIAICSQDFNSGGRPRYPYRHPIIQKVVNITWFQNMDDIGIIFYEHFNPIPFEVIALVLTVVRSKLRALTLDFDGLYTLSSDRVLHRRVVHWNIQRVQLERSGLQNQLRLASQLAS